MKVESVTRAVAVFLLALAALSSAAAQEVPPDVADMARKARLEGAISAWCRAEFRSGRPGAFAVAVASPTGGGRYVALDPDGRARELAAFTSGADLSCYTRASAEKLDRTIKQSETIHGQISPWWRTTVVCGFLDDTTAACWQYSPADRTFVKVGEWIT